MDIEQTTSGRNKLFRVMTFLHPRENRAPLVLAYTRSASVGWEGCKVIEVAAKNGSEAKRIAIKMRRELGE